MFCVGHALHNLVVKDGIAKCDNLSNLISKIRDIVKALRYRVSEFEHLSKNYIALAKELSDFGESLEDSDYEDEVIATQSIETLTVSKTLKLDVKTRWHSKLTMLESVAAQDRNVVNVLLAKYINDLLTSQE